MFFSSPVKPVAVILPGIKKIPEITGIPLNLSEFAKIDLNSPDFA